MSRSPARGASATILHAANRRIYGQWTSSHPQPLRRRAARGAYRGRNDDDRRRKPVARAMERARRPLRPPRPPRNPMRASDPRPRLAARAPGGSFNPSPQRVIEARASRRQPRQQGPRRPRARPARVPRQVRLRHDRRDRRQQARDRLRACGPEEGARQLRERGVRRSELVCRPDFSQPTPDLVQGAPLLIRFHREWPLDTSVRRMRG